MLNVCGYPAAEIKDAPWVLYTCRTTHGSVLDVYWRRTHILHSSKDPSKRVADVGELYIKGYSVSQHKDVELAGLGFEPEADGKVAVGTCGKDQDGMDILAEERILSIDKIEEVGKSPIE